MQVLLIFLYLTETIEMSQSYFVFWYLVGSERSCFEYRLPYLISNADSTGYNFLLIWNDQNNIQGLPYLSDPKLMKLHYLISQCLIYSFGHL